MSKNAIDRKKICHFHNHNGALREHRKFIVKCFIKIESQVAAQRAFRKKFKFKKYNSILSYSQLVSG